MLFEIFLYGDFVCECAPHEKVSFVGGFQLPHFFPPPPGFPHCPRLHDRSKACLWGISACGILFPNQFFLLINDSDISFLQGPQKPHQVPTPSFIYPHILKGQPLQIFPCQVPPSRDVCKLCDPHHQKLLSFLWVEHGNSRFLHKSSEPILIREPSPTFLSKPCFMISKEWVTTFQMFEAPKCCSWDYGSSLELIRGGCTCSKSLPSKGYWW